METGRQKYFHSQGDEEDKEYSVNGDRDAEIRSNFLSEKGKAGHAEDYFRIFILNKIANGLKDQTKHQTKSNKTKGQACFVSLKVIKTKLNRQLIFWYQQTKLTITIKLNLKNNIFCLGERDKVTQAEEKIEQAFNYIDSNGYLLILIVVV